MSNSQIDFHNHHNCAAIDHDEQFDKMFRELEGSTTFATPIVSQEVILSVLRQQARLIQELFKNTKFLDSPDPIGRNQIDQDQNTPVDNNRIQSPSSTGRIDINEQVQENRIQMLEMPNSSVLIDVESVKSQIEQWKSNVEILKESIMSELSTIRERQNDLSNQLAYVSRQSSTRTFTDDDIRAATSLLETQIGHLHLKVELAADAAREMHRAPASADRVEVSAPEADGAPGDKRIPLQDLLTSMQQQIIDNRSHSEFLKQRTQQLSETAADRVEMRALGERMREVEAWRAQRTAAIEAAELDEQSWRLRASEAAGALEAELASRVEAITGELRLLRIRVEDNGTQIKEQARVAERIEAEQREAAIRQRQELDKVQSLKADRTDILTLQEAGVRAEAAANRLAMMSSERSRDYYSKPEVNSFLESKIDRVDFEDFAKLLIKAVDRPAGKKSTSNGGLRPLLKRPLGIGSGQLEAAIPRSLTYGSLPQSRSASERNLEVRPSADTTSAAIPEGDPSSSLRTEQQRTRNPLSSGEGFTDQDFTVDFESYTRFRRGVAKSGMVAKPLQIEDQQGGIAAPGLDDGDELRINSQPRSATAPSRRPDRVSSAGADYRPATAVQISDESEPGDEDHYERPQSAKHLQASLQPISAHKPPDSSIMFRGRDGRYYFTDEGEHPQQDGPPVPSAAATPGPASSVGRGPSSVNMVGDGLPRILPLRPQQQMKITHHQ